jgi:glutamate--cysteine ligase
MQGICQIMDEGEQDKPYSESLQLQCEAIDDPDRTPSAIMLAEMRNNKEGFHEFAKRLSQQHEQYFKAMSLNAEKRLFFSELAKNSIGKQIEIEQADDISFDEYLRRYFAQS